MKSLGAICPLSESTAGDASCQSDSMIRSDSERYYYAAR